MTKAPPRVAAILLAVLVTFLWSTSWVLIKIGLRNALPPLTFAGLRYSFGFLGLAPFVLGSRTERAIIKNMPRPDWIRLVVLGLIIIAVAQGAQFVALAYLPAVMVSLLLNLTPIMVGLMSLLWYREQPTPMQWLGILISLAGTLVYFLPLDLPHAALTGILAAAIGMLSNAYGSLLGRQANQQQHLSPLVVTSVSMGVGSTLMLALGWLTQGLGHPSGIDWAIIGWLALVNTALAFTLWNHIQRTLTAVESSIINSLMMPQIAILAYLFLGETLSVKEIFGLALVATGVVIVQVRKSRARLRSELSTERPI